MNRAFGLRDKIDQGSGLVLKTAADAQFSLQESTLVVDTRDCIGTVSLDDARSYFKFIGKRPTAAYGTVVNLTNTSPIVATLDSVAEVRNGDVLTFSEVRGTTNANGPHVVSSVDYLLNTLVLDVGADAPWSPGSGSWSRAADPGYPQVTQTDSTVVGNTITVSMYPEIKQIRSLSLFHAVIPRDIIPLDYILHDFVSASITREDVVYPGIAVSDFTNVIPQEEKMMRSRLLGFYSSPLDLWRTYDGAAFSLSNQTTPPPLKLWNPSGPGIWPLQPTPYPFQTVPTYRSNTFSTDKYLILAGYGVYDLVDWTVNTGNPVADSVSTSIIRKLLLLLICPVQSYKNMDYVDLILNSNTVSNEDPAFAFGFGDFQRYVPGPGVGQNYQPGSNTSYNNGGLGSGPCNVPQLDSPVAFPDFHGNVWGPYDGPGARFQKFGLKDTVQDLFLNGDLNNLFGNPLILPNVPAEAISIDPNFGLNFAAQISVSLGNITNATNPNILNSMRISSNGFGAAVVRAKGSGTYYTSRFNATAGGIGLSSLGAPSSWVNRGIYDPAGSFADPIAAGPAAAVQTPASSDASTSGITGPVNAVSYVDRGPANGAFISGILNYIGYAVKDIPDTDLIVRIEEAPRDDAVQGTRPANNDAILDLPVRLSLGSTSGTLEYMESVQSLLAQASGYWEKRFINGKSGLKRLHIRFFDYEGRPIPLEKMLQLRGVSESLRLLTRVDTFLDSSFNLSSTGISRFSFLFDPTNPQLIGRVKRYIQMIFKVTSYIGTPPGTALSTALDPATAFQ